MSRRAAQYPNAEPRGSARHKVFLPAEMTHAGGASRVHLLNLSPAGALVHGDAVPRPGAVVQISCASATWPARVVWAQHKRFGLIHMTPLAPKVMATLVGQSAG